MYLKRMLGDGLLCAFLVGSRTEPSKARVTSDYDFVAVTDGAFSQRSRKTVQGCEIDLFVLPYERLRRDLAPTGRPYIVRMLASAKPIYDAANLSDAVVRHAQRVLSDGRRPGVSFQLVARPVDVYRDVENLHRDDPYSTALLVAEFVRTSFELLLQRCGVWPNSTRRLFSEVEICDTMAASLARDVLQDRTPWPKRLELMRALYRRCADREIDRAENYVGPRVIHQTAARSPVVVSARRIDYAV